MNPELFGLNITPGSDKAFAVALIGPGDAFERLSEHDSFWDARAALLLARAAADDATLKLNRIVKEAA